MGSTLRTKKRSVAFYAAILAAFAIAIVSSAAACLPTGRACLPGDYAPCTCANGAAGGALCDAIGSSFGSCDCTILLDAAIDENDAANDVDDDASSSDSGGMCSGTSNLELTCPCSDDSDCASDFCFTYPSKGPHCSAHCTTDAQCPPPALGCNPQGVCKVP
jgi:hypothetical protein